MLARGFRLRSAADFNKTYKFGRSINAADFYIRYLKTNQPVTRVAVVVSKKISKRAVVRNRIKRRLQEQVRLLWDNLKPGYNVIVGVKADISNTDISHLKTELSQSLDRAGINK